MTFGNGAVETKSYNDRLQPSQISLRPLKPRFHRQETTYSCVPACLRIALSSFNVEITEERLGELCDCTPVLGI